MRKIPVAAHLNDEEYKMFLEVYASHNSSMGLKEREKYSLSHVVKVERTMEENCLIVRFDDGEWWHYCGDETWY